MTDLIHLPQVENAFNLEYKLLKKIDFLDKTLGILKCAFRDTSRMYWCQPPGEDLDDGLDQLSFESRFRSPKFKSSDSDTEYITSGSKGRVLAFIDGWGAATDRPLYYIILSGSTPTLCFFLEDVTTQAEELLKVGVVASVQLV